MQTKKKRQFILRFRDFSAFLCVNYAMVKGVPELQMFGLACSTFSFDDESSILDSVSVDKKCTKEMLGKKSM